MKQITFLGIGILFFAMTIPLKSQTSAERIQFYKDYQNAVNKKSAMIKADPVLYQEAVKNGWFQQVETGLQNALDFANGTGGSLNVPIVGATCETSQPFCTQSGTTYPAGVGTGTGQSGPCYSCLGSTPNPAWYYMKILTGGDLHITETNSANVDIDFCLWGPFPSQNSCSSISSCGTVIDCSYSSQPTEYIDIASCSAGQYFILIVTNFSNQPTNITLAKTGGSAETDCSILNPVTATITGITHLSCYGGSNGSATVSAGGGTAPYTYAWSTSPVQTNATATGLTAGSYTVTVTDAGSSTATASATLTQPGAVVATASVVTHVLCYSYSTGSVTVSASGGTSGYSYYWSNGSTNQTATGLPAGTYSVTVTDAHSCTATSSTTVTQPPQWWPSLTGPSPICQNTSGVYTTDAGMSNYTWSTSPGGTITAGGTSTNNTATVTWNGSGAQTVSVNYTDLNGCVAYAPGVKNVTVWPAPTPVISGANVVTQGQTVTYSTPYVPGHSYSWSASHGNAVPCLPNMNCLTIMWDFPCGIINPGFVRVTETDMTTGCTTTTTL
jgi:hypothetical protein